jgi:hypothetical protein
MVASAVGNLLDQFDRLQAFSSTIHITSTTTTLDDSLHAHSIGTPRLSGS